MESCWGPSKAVHNPAMHGLYVRGVKDAFGSDLDEVSPARLALTTISFAFARYGRVWGTSPVSLASLSNIFPTLPPGWEVGTEIAKTMNTLRSFLGLVHAFFGPDRIPCVQHPTRLPSCDSCASRQPCFGPLLKPFCSPIF